MSAAIGQLGRVNLFTLTIRKLGYFWLSFDQLFRTQSLSRGKFLLRLAGIVVYWPLLGIGVEGWRRLRSRNPDPALLFTKYPIVITVMHVLFVMSAFGRPF